MINGMDEERALNLLAEGELTLEGQFVRGSNYTFLGSIRHEGEETKVVYKPTRGENPLWDFPTGTLAKRETAAYLTSRYLGWNLVPPTLYRRKQLPLGPGMVQLFVEHDPRFHYFNFPDEIRARLKIVAVFDLLINNADRKGSHVLLGMDGRLWCIDHGICFHHEDKLRTVIWDFAGEPIPAELLADLESLTATATEYSLAMKKYLRASEIRAVLARAEGMIQWGAFRTPGTDRRMYPYPPV
jgi:hypothetical protein